MQCITNMGIRCSNFHTTALTLLTGRNAANNNMARIIGASAGFPGLPIRIPFESEFIHVELFKSEGILI
jgi:arylsulfatase A-like enzyme